MIKVELGRVNEKRELLLDGDEMIFTEGAIRIFKDSKLIGFFDIDDLINVYDESQVKVYVNVNGIHMMDWKKTKEPMENGIIYCDTDDVKGNAVTIASSLNTYPLNVMNCRDYQNELPYELKGKVVSNENKTKEILPHSKDSE